MNILTALYHRTDYRYDRPVTLGMQTIRLRPAPHTRSPVQSYSLKISPKDHFINWQQDPLGNYLARVVFPKKTAEFRVEVDLVTKIRAFNPLDFFLEDSAKDFPFNYPSDVKRTLLPYLQIKERGPLLLAWLKHVDRHPQSIIDFLVMINRSLNQQLQYVIRLQPGVQSCEETLLLKTGSCRDMAWLLCQLLRHLGLATRFVSGYLIQLKADMKALDGPSGTSKDFTDLHAWTEVYLPGAGWVGLDPTSGLFAGEGHIPLCCTPEPATAAPISGTIESCEATFSYDMKVTRLEEERRVTKPYRESTWKKIDALGLKVDRDLAKRDVRLTMGGEPTFVSQDDRDGDEWHFSASSDNKKALGNRLLLRLRESFATGALLHHTQGKWYPGEILPRWAMHCYWRTDNEPLWQNPSLLADPQKDHGHTLKIAQRFLNALARMLVIPVSYILPVHEDTPFYLWKEQRLPIEGDILKADVFELHERKRLQTLLDGHLNTPGGLVLPLNFSVKRKRWISNRWRFSSGHCVLIPGDSSIGLRLPLASLPFVDPRLVAEEQGHERSAFENVTSLPKRADFLTTLHQQEAQKNRSDVAFAKDPNGLVRTALCAEIKTGTLHLFLPPLCYLEHYIELIIAIESVAEKYQIPVVIEGYGPPKDLRLASFSITPDPGVLEVNVQPAVDWDTLKKITTTVYQEARQARLSPDRFLLDGRRVGTGGGNHIVVGGATPENSPFLRRPDLLQSLITFWQNHPSLSYLFAGLYIGPTSQSPRIDEARQDSLYELEIAFRQIQPKAKAPPWLVDRLFRNLLVDLTGNTHRAEFCIDKLYSPESERGRLGLLEMRGFEMTPHPRLNLLQALLVRATIAHFWKDPYRGSLIRWRTQLHDRYMLPYYVWEDFAEVLKVLKVGGYHFERDWFLPFFDFRFAACGSIQLGSITLELRVALEPWPVMGEEMNAVGMSRSVDSSVERLQVRVTGAVPGRHIVTCNGRRLPMQPTAEEGVAVAGVRYKAWAPCSSLHPVLPANTPLVFDVVDVYHERSLGGCTYHVAHPGGRNYERYPVNENEAEGRRLSRFQAVGHTPSRMKIPPLETHPDFPHTLDLRL